MCSQSESLWIVQSNKQTVKMCIRGLTHPSFKVFIKYTQESLDQIKTCHNSTEIMWLHYQ